MANSNTVAQVYADTCKLAFTETQMAISPRAPFKIADRPKLMDQSGECAGVAKDFREKGDAASMDQAKVDDAANRLKAAQSMFDYINSQTSNNFKSSDVFKRVTEAIQAVRACL
jgi:hypothetical protein